MTPCGSDVADRCEGHFVQMPGLYPGNSLLADPCREGEVDLAPRATPSNGSKGESDSNIFHAESMSDVDWRPLMCGYPRC